MNQNLIRIRALPQHHGYDYDIIEMPMTSEDRQRVRRRVVARNGQEFALELPTGTTLNTGQILYIKDKYAYVVAASPEDVLVITPRTIEEAVFIGHLIGNLHRDIEIVNEQIIALWNAPLEERLKREGLDAIRTQHPFKGKPAGEHSH